MTAQFQFVMRSGPTPGKVFPLEGPEIIIGRDNTSSLMINDAEVSRKHTRLVWQSLGYVVEDLGSTNGTFVNGQRLTTPFVLRGGESVSLGENIVLVFESIVLVNESISGDPDATVISTSAREVKQAIAEAQPYIEDSEPASLDSTLIYSEPISIPAALVPPKPAPVIPVMAQPVAPKKSNKKMVILLVVLLGFLCVCSVIAIALYRAPISFWCDNLSFYFKPELYPQCVP